MHEHFDELNVHTFYQLMLFIGLIVIPHSTDWHLMMDLSLPPPPQKHHPNISAEKELRKQKKGNISEGSDGDHPSFICQKPRSRINKVKKKTPL